METTVKNQANQEVVITLVLEEKDISPYREKAASILGKKVKIKGFRPGKAPVNMIENHVGKPFFVDEMLNLAIPEVLPKALDAEKITPIVSPKVKVTEVEPLTLEVTVALMPKVTLKDVDKIKIKKEKIEATKEEIDGTIYEFQKLHSTYTDVDGPAKKGQRVEIDFEGFDEDGKSLDGTSSKNHPIIIGDNTFVPGFEDNLVGMKKDETKEFTVTFPKDYHRDDFQNKKVKFKVTVKRIEDVELAKVDKELSQKVIQEELDEKEFRAKLAENITKQKEQKEAQRQQAELFNELLKHAEIEMSDLLVESELDYMIHQHKHEVANHGIDWQQYLQMLESQGKDLREDRREEASDRVKARFIIRELVEVKGFAPDKDEVIAELKTQNIDKEHHNEESKVYAQAYDKLILDKIFGAFIE